MLRASQQSRLATRRTSFAASSRFLSNQHLIRMRESSKRCLQTSRRELFTSSPPIAQQSHGNNYYHHPPSSGRRTALRVLQFAMLLTTTVRGFVPLPFTRTTTLLTQQQQFFSTTTATSLWTDIPTVPLQHSEFTTTTTTTTTTATPVLFLHGLLGNRRNFATIGRSLAAQLERPRRIVAVDLRNHGESSHAESMTYTTMAADVVHFLNQHALDKVVLVGHSMGGKVAQAMALLAPERVDGLVVLDMAPVRYSAQDEHWKAVVDILQTLHALPGSHKEDKKQVDAYLKPHVPDPALRAFCLTNWDAQQKEWKIPIAYIVDALDHLADFEIPTDRQYAGDVFLIHGGQSRFVKHSYLPTVAQYFPNHLLTTIKGAGHWVHAEAPEDTTALLKRYLDR